MYIKKGAGIRRLCPERVTVIFDRTKRVRSTAAFVRGRNRTRTGTSIIVLIPVPWDCGDKCKICASRGDISLALAVLLLSLSSSAGGKNGASRIRLPDLG